MTNSTSTAEAEVARLTAELDAARTERDRLRALSTSNPHDHTPSEERRIREAALDETIAGSFPASDPPSTLPNPDEHDAEGSGVESGVDEKDSAAKT